MRQARDGPVELHTICLAFANDIVCSFALDYSMNLLKDTSPSETVESNHQRHRKYDSLD